MQTVERLRLTTIVSVLALIPALLLADFPLAIARVGIASLLAGVFDALDLARPLQSALPSLPIDPVYGGIAISVITGLDLRGVVVAGPLGLGLHALLPGVFASPELLGRDWAATVVAPGGSITARFLLLLYAEMGLLALGILASHLSYRRGASPSRLGQGVGVLLQASAVGSLLALLVVSPDYERMGLAPVINKLAGARTMSAYREIAGIAVPLVRVAVPIAAIASVYSGCLLVMNLRSLVRRWRLSRSRLSVRPRLSVGRAPAIALLAAVQVAFVASGVGPRGVFVSEPSAVQAATLGELPAAAPSAEPQPTRADRSVLNVAATPSEAPRRPHAQQIGPTVVEVRGGNYQYQLLVNGQPRVVKGMGYNAEYSTMPEATRRQLYTRDFSAMRRANVELIQGWDMAEFDGVFLDVAQQQSLGVVMPIDLPVDGDYSNPDYRAQLEAEIEARVNRYKDHPALWMWGLGNEVLHGVTAPDQAAAFAAAYPELADFVHALDPNHPVFYRDAEDVFVAPMRDAMLAAGVARPWFIYGINIFTDRIEPVVNTWPTHGWDVPIVLSEFGPMAYPAPDRPDGYRWMWSVIRGQPDYVLGGLVYVWFTNGPDPLDPMFGLVDGSGAAVDGALSAIKGIFAGTPAGATTSGGQ